jgi:riboflavin kinase/FMN adenylyltransferase
MELTVVEPLVAGDSYVSSSRIRGLIAAGNVKEASALLTHPYRIRGMVTHGQSRGASLGFPTANLEAIDTLLPAAGVYAGRAWIDHVQHWAAIHIGPNPTFADGMMKVEIHLLDFSGSIYGQILEVDFVDRLRDVRRFDSAEALQEQVRQDVALTRQAATEYDY